MISPQPVEADTNPPFKVRKKQVSTAQSQAPLSSPLGRQVTSPSTEPGRTLAVASQPWSFCFSLAPAPEADEYKRYAQARCNV